MKQRRLLVSLHILENYDAISDEFELTGVNNVDVFSDEASSATRCSAMSGCSSPTEPMAAS